jgi:hypothetical protein
MFGTDGRAFHRPLAISVAGLMLAGVGLAVIALVLAVAHRETGQALVYILVAIALTGVAVMALRGTRWVIRAIIVVLAGTARRDRRNRMGAQPRYRCPESPPVTPARVRSNGGRGHQLDLFQYRVRGVLLVRHTLARSAATPTCVLACCDDRC